MGCWTSLRRSGKEGGGEVGWAEGGEVATAFSNEGIFKNMGVQGDYELLHAARAEGAKSGSG